MFATAQKLNNLTLIIDYNKWQATGRSEKVLNIKSWSTEIFRMGHFYNKWS